MDRLIIALSAGALLLISLSIKYWCDRIRFLAAQHKTEQALDHLRAILDAASEVSIIATDLEGTITSFNRGAEKMLGYAAHEMIGKNSPLSFHLPHEVSERADALSRETGRKVEGFDVFIESSTAKTAEKRLWTYIRKDGAKLPVSLTVTPIRDKNGQVCGYLGIAADASKDDRATRAEEEIRLSGTLVRKTLEAQEKERASLYGRAGEGA
ncbi:PAS domain S-box protein [uncultured Paenibacillus sp.]|uniref:PAS domain-containing protein n=1 Tax=uncultured Paenibacillus sp. TaxID=227322 RepID=UPI0028D1C9BE|nr:PAS domain S-box protein [uncultured Paenibacillus sp.]